MCVGSIALVAEIREQEGVRVARLDDGCVVPLSFVPGAQPGDALLLHLGIPVEVLDPDDAHELLCLRAEAAAASAQHDQTQAANPDKHPTLGGADREQA